MCNTKGYLKPEWSSATVPFLCAYLANRADCDKALFGLEAFQMLTYTAVLFGHVPSFFPLDQGNMTKGIK